MLELPDFSPLTITQHTAPPKLASFASLDHLAVVVPAKPKRTLFDSLPKGRQLKVAFDRAGRKSRVVARLDNRRATGLSLTPALSGNPFEELGWARKLVAGCLAEQPVSLGVLAAGFDAGERDRILLAIAAAAAAAAFRLPSFKSKAPRRRFRSLKLFAPAPRLDLGALLAGAAGNNIARWFTALPPNRLTAADYRNAIGQLAAEHSLDCEFLGEKRLEELGAGAFLAVSQGNAERDAGIVRVMYRPAKQAAPEIALVGKGILFDTGGTNLKPFKGMLDMHTDMQGSAVALGCLIALAKLECPLAVDAWLAVTENVLSATAYKSQDVVVASNGTSIQVIHTDAEGRMVLADTLAIAARTGPELIIDFATLTGACVAALTTRYSGLFSNRPAAYAMLASRAAEAGERIWPFPMDNDFDDALKSDVADIKQCAVDTAGDHILAARFLKRFVPDSIPWVHIDLSAGQHKGGLAHVPTDITGFGVRAVLNWLDHRARAPAEFAEAFGE